VSGPDTVTDAPRRAAGLRGAPPLRTGDALAQLGFADIDPIPAAGGGRGGGLRGAGPIRRGDALSKRGFANVLAAGAPAAELMKPGALRGAARGRDLDSLPHTLFLRIYPVIGALLLLTQLGIAWVNYTDQLRLYDDRAHLLARLTAASIARPDWARSAEAYGGPLKALSAEPAFRHAILRDADGHLVGTAGAPPSARGWSTLSATADLPGPGLGHASGSLTVTFSTRELRDNAVWQAMLALGASVGLMIAFVITLHATVRRHVMAPLMRLLLAMREIEHKRWTTVDLGGAYRPSNEIDVISQAFNRMVEGLRSGDAAKQLLLELELAHDRLERANRQVVESIGYARRIQDSVLPDRNALAAAGVEVAVLWEPLHVVGGDYFWLEAIDDLCVIAVADCTGHGVPGAFLTLIVATSLDRLLHERGLRSPAAILAGLDAMVRTQLRQDGRGAESDDGLDCGICVWDRAAGTLRFAGAGLSLTTVRDGVAERVRGGRRGLGYPRTGREALPEDVAVPVAGATFYLMTDGITDQMGRADPDRAPRLLGQRGVTDSLLRHAHRPLAEQPAALEAELDAYRGGEARRDDMTLVAFRFPPEARA
jgi:phosphoserine phosphatase RsbU/P